ncbi:aromatic ring-hydroxylating oxygenase subunit alpha [Parachitinimonas caeni]|uniref:Aromatic ring-hydroxylating dioxygenase subunit alpha n=1 Tax=Parachitinimonas caeni TaxID=3031301 RepID=A0ABT7DZ17_9NEIS|nr:aromatic ring-hydroxylating dioxygenase subunit alpha [Parachitinimonas caeni]MDK2125249.1 aromatic ring-hydroxylating dioxygenase subunit alpha [Parachitinimonas caeni]
MSNLAQSNLLQAANAQLPVSAYFDESLYQLELERLFARGPRYFGHELMVPNTGDYQVLEMTDGAHYLKRAEDGIKLLSNVCRHRQAVMLQGRGNASTTVCPLHRWTYDNGGKLIGAPHFPQNPCLHLPETELVSWNGLLFDARRDVFADLAKLGVAKELDFANYHFHSVQVEHYQGNWKTFIEVYLEDYHVVPFHPGLGQFVECDDLKWEFGDWYSVQTVGVNNRLAKAGSKVYADWHKQVLDFYQGEVPAHGAIWLTYYPGIMVEWYPHVLVISTIVPTGVRSYKNVVEFYYPEEIALFEPDFIAAEQAAYMETAVEDAEIIRRMEEGREALYRAGRNEVGPYQSPMEDGMAHFHEFLRRELGDAIRD